MNVSLPPELERFVSATVESGRYNSPAEVVCEALRLLEEHERARSAEGAEFNRELERRLASLDRGEHVEPSVVRASLQRKSDDRRKQRA
jgi:antitoxin ParD1/3/4